MKLIPTRQRVRATWEKYGLIVVGNIVFFALLYFVSYRPHNEESRAGEFLSLAQQAESEEKFSAAMVLYRKVVADYPGTRSAKTAGSRISMLKKKTKNIPRQPTPQKVQPVLDIDKMLDQRPAVFVAKFLARHYDDDEEMKPRLLDTIGQYLKIAINYDGVSLQNLKAEKEFQRPAFQKAFFNLKPICQMKTGWIYDDFFVRNTGVFPWHNVRVQMTVGQGENQTSADIRIPRLLPGRSYEIVDFRVSKSGGDVFCRGKITAREGSAQFHNRL